MTYSAALAFLHHAAAFLLVAALMVELVLIKAELTPGSARSILRMDALYGIAAAAVIVIGLGRVFYTEKGAGYYFSSAPFVLKMALFALAGILSIYPTKHFLRWRTALRSGQLPVLEEPRRAWIRRIIHIELVLVFGVILCAVLMARGIGLMG
jgi:putative membrane protein